MCERIPARGTTERLNEQLERNSRSLPVIEHPRQSYTQSEDNDEGIDGTGVSWPSREKAAQEDRNMADQEKAAADQAHQPQEHQSSAEKEEGSDDDEGVDGSGITWNNSS